MLDFPADAVAAVTDAVLDMWPRGIQTRRAYAGSHELKLAGAPWHGDGEAGDAATATTTTTTASETGGKGEALMGMDTTRLLLRTVAALDALGWRLLAAAVVMTAGTRKPTMFFSRDGGVGKVEGVQTQWMALSPWRQDRLRIVGATARTVQALGAAVGDLLLETRVAAGETEIAELRLRETMWCAMGEATMRARRVWLSVLASLRDEGWEVRGTVAVAGVDVWLCARERKADGEGECDG